MLKQNKDAIKDKELDEKIQAYLYSLYAKNLQYARIDEVYDAVCALIMNKLGRIWAKSKSNPQNMNIYVLSFEYLPGRFIENKIKKLGLESDLNKALSKIGYDLSEIVNQEQEADLGIGEIGMVANYLIQELTNHKIKAMAYGLRYENGSMKQKIASGMQMEYGDHRLNKGSNREHQKVFFHYFKMGDHLVKSHAFDIPITSDDGTYINTMRLWKAAPMEKVDYRFFSQGDFSSAYKDYVNSNSITQFLYIDNSSYEGKLFRLKQEYFYAVSSIQDIFRRFSKIHQSVDNIDNSINIYTFDIHPSISILVFIQILNQGYDIELSDAIKISRRVFNHFCISLTDDSRENYDLSMIKKIDPDFCDFLLELDAELQKSGQNIINNNQLCYLEVNKYLSGQFIFPSKTVKNSYNYKNGATINIGIDRNLYSSMNNRKLYKLLQTYDVRGTSYNEINKLEDLKGNSKLINDLEDLKFKKKEEFAKAIEETNSIPINPYSIFDMQIEGFHEGNRQILNALSIASLFYLLRDNCNLAISPITFVFSGKANSGYYMAKESLKFILALSEMIRKDKIIKDKLRIVFVEDMNVTRIKELLPAIDVRSSMVDPLYKNADFEILASCFNFSNIISSKGGILENIDRENKIYSFGQTYDKLKQLKESGSYRAIDYYYQNRLVNDTVNRLLSEPRSNLPYNFKIIYDEIMRYNDSFFNFYDLEDLFNTRLKVAQDYLDKDKRVENEIENILWANEFSIEEDLKNLMNNL